MMVNAGYFISHKIGDIPAVFLGVHADHIVVLRHIGAHLFIWEHFDLECFQHLGCAQLVNPAVIAERGWYAAQSKQTLESEDRSNGIRIGEIMCLYVDMPVKAERRKLVEVIHCLTLVY